MSGGLDEQLGRIVDAGYTGFEAALPPEGSADSFTRVRKQYDLPYITLIWTVGPDHGASFSSLVDQAARLEPVHITVQGALDSMTFDEKVAFFTHALDVEARIGIPIAHETHRERALFSPWDTAALLKGSPRA